MPELPEVECLTRAVRQAIVGKSVEKIDFKRKSLRDAIPTKTLQKSLCGKKILEVSRRSKYMLWDTGKDLGIFHLGMTGNLRLLPEAKPQFPHTHVIFHLNSDVFLHYIDPRRFGRISCCAKDAYDTHKFFQHLGPEPLEHKNLGKYLFLESRGKKRPVKTFLMDAAVVVGVGNIYANEALFRTRLHPETLALSLDESQYRQLAQNVKKTLREAIKAGGTTLRDFHSADGKPGYFAHSHNVYNRKDQPCKTCSSPIEQLRQSGRSTFLCPRCQTHFDTPK